MTPISFIKEHVDLTAYISRFEPVASGRAAHAVAHEGKGGGACLSISEDLWNCHYCGQGGSLIDYEMSREGHSDPVRAAEEIAIQMNLRLPTGIYETAESQAAATKVRQIREAAATFYHQQLLDDADGIQYFHERGFTHSGISESVFGRAPNRRDALIHHVIDTMNLSIDKDSELLLESRLFKMNGARLIDYFRNRYVIPFFDTDGAPNYFVGRAIQADTTPKYLNLLGAVPLWNSAEIRMNLNADSPKPMLICEGFFDGALARQELKEFAVCAAGGASLSKGQIEEIAPRLAETPTRIVFCFDREAGGCGERGAQTSAKKLRDAIVKAADGDDTPDVRIARLPRPPELDKVDLADFLVNRGARKARRWLAAAEPIERFEKRLSGDPSRFFSGGRGSTDGSFRPVWLSDELQLESFFLASGEALFHYHNGVFVEQPDAVERRIKELLGDLWKPSRAEETLKAISVDVKINPELLNRQHVINFKNGMVELTTDELQLRPHSPYELSTLQVQAEFLPELPPFPNLDKFLQEVLHPKDDLRIAEMVGYAMDHSTDLHKAFLLVGKGANGKGTLIKVLTAILGARNVCTIGLQELEESRWATARMFGKSANLVGDMELSALKRSAIFKSIVAGDRVGAERKNKPHFEFEPTATQVLSMNRLPANFDRSEGFYRRLAIVEFPNSFSGENAIAPRELLARLTTPGELNGFASFCLHAYKAALSRGHLTESERGRAMLAEYQEENEPELRFFREALCIADGDAFLSIAEIYDSYLHWLESEFAGRRAMPKRRLTKRLQEIFELGEPVRKKRAGRTERGYATLGWREGHLTAD